MSQALDTVWLMLRSPFKYPKAGHDCKWERFDADKTGCVLCGELDKCSSSMVGCKCPLAEADHGTHVCLITGLCISEVITGTDKYVDYVVFEYERPGDDDSLFDRVLVVVHAFLTARSTAKCRQMGREKYTQRTRQAFVRVLKQRKRDRPCDLPCVCSVVSEVACLMQQG